MREERIEEKFDFEGQIVSVGRYRIDGGAGGDNIGVALESITLENGGHPWW